MKNEQFTKDDLKAGYVVKHRNGETSAVMKLDDGRTIFQNANNGRWSCVRQGNSAYPSFYKDDLSTIHHDSTHLDVMEVYGYAKYAHFSLIFTTKDRPLLWKREEKTCDSCAHKVVCTHVGMCEHYLEVVNK